VNKSLLSTFFVIAALLSACGGGGDAPLTRLDQAIGDVSRTQLEQFDLRIKIHAERDGMARATLVREYDVVAIEMHSLVVKFAIDPIWCMFPTPRDFSRFDSPAQCVEDFELAQQRMR
jgi:hypothetical protein